MRQLAICLLLGSGIGLAQGLPVIDSCPSDPTAPVTWGGAAAGEYNETFEPPGIYPCDMDLNRAIIDPTTGVPQLLAEGSAWVMLNCFDRLAQVNFPPPGRCPNTCIVDPGGHQGICSQGIRDTFNNPSYRWGNMNPSQIQILMSVLTGIPLDDRIAALPRIVQALLGYTSSLSAFGCQARLMPLGPPNQCRLVFNCQGFCEANVRRQLVCGCHDPLGGECCFPGIGAFGTSETADTLAGQPGKGGH